MFDFLIQYRIILASAALVTMIAAYFFRRQQKGKKPYVSVVAKIEGGGIKRGLTAPEASIVLIAPITNTLLLIGLQLLKKGVLLSKEGEDIILGVASNYSHVQSTRSSSEREKMRKDEAQKNSIVIQPYEHMMIELIDQLGMKPWIEIDFSVLVRPMISSVAERVAGYSLEETRKYYQAIIKRAPVEARTDGKLVSDLDKVVDKNILWILQNEKANILFEREFKSYSPEWMNVNHRNIVSETNIYAWFHDVVSNMLPINSSKYDTRANLHSMNSVAARLHEDISEATFYG